LYVFDDVLQRKMQTAQMVGFVLRIVI